MKALPKPWRRFLAGVVSLLAGGGFLGLLYGKPMWGFAAGMLVLLVWQTWHLLRFERALRTRTFDWSPVGEGIWSQMYSHVRHLRQRQRLHKRSYRDLVREVRELANALPDGAIVLNADNEIVLCNAAAGELAGFDPRRDRGQRVDNILRDPAFADSLKSGDANVRIEIPSPVREGSWLYCHLVTYGAGERLLLIRDVTERRRLASMRRQFVANASHELRSPLTVIAGYLDTLADDPEVPAHWQKPLDRMREQSTRMSRIVNDLLSLSRLEASARVADEQTIDVPALLESAANLHREGSSAPAIRIHAETGDQLSGSSSEIESVVRNLLSNAVRHTPSGGTIDMTWRSVAGGAELVVADTGEGIADELIPRLTERFFRVDRGRSRDEGGVGLGLSIVKHVLSRHGAELEIESTLGKGSRFTCRFPAERIVPQRTITTEHARA